MQNAQTQDRRWLAAGADAGPKEGALPRLDALLSAAALVGRVFLAQIFILAGISKIGGWVGTAGYMASKGMPLVPLFLAATIFVEIAGGVSVLAGLRARWGAILLALFLVPVTLVFHDFWAAAGQARMVQSAMFMKNVAIIGGLLTLAAAGPGRFSLDRWLSTRRSGRDQT
jgi:putative oxidoreductase